MSRTHTRTHTRTENHVASRYVYQNSLKCPVSTVDLPHTQCVLESPCRLRGGTRRRALQSNSRQTPRHMDPPPVKAVFEQF